MTIQSIEIGLFEPGMTVLHRAGLGGLAMTLAQVHDNPASEARLREIGGWEVAAHTVHLSWRDADTFFPALFAYAYPITQDGLIAFGALGDPMGRIAETCVTHSAMLDSFLQHNKHRKAEERSTASGALTADIDGLPLPLKYQRVFDHKFRWERFSPDKVARGIGWLVPGGVVRHNAIATDTALEEPPRRALALRFAPIGCLYFAVRERRREGVIRYPSAVVVPDVRDLEDYTDLRRLMRSTSTHDIYTAGPAEAALRYLSMDAAMQAQGRAAVPGCQVLSLARLPWSKQQQTRSYVLTVPNLEPEARQQYAALRRHLRPRRVARDDATAWIDVPQVPELAAENLLHGRPWWQGFTVWIADPARRAHIFRFEQEGLNAMVNDSRVTPDADERAFVHACHEAWRNRLARIGQRAREQGLDFPTLASREKDKLRATLARCKTAADLRAVIADFWARAGAVATLQQEWPQMLPFLDQRRWQAGRDLALVALASYRGPESPREAEPAIQQQEEE